MLEVVFHADIEHQNALADKHSTPTSIDLSAGDRYGERSGWILCTPLHCSNKREDHHEEFSDNVQLLMCNTAVLLSLLGQRSSK